MCPLKSLKLLRNISKCHKTCTALLRKQLFWPGMLSSPLVRVIDIVQRGIIMLCARLVALADTLLAGAMTALDAQAPGELLLTGPEAVAERKWCAVPQSDSYPEARRFIVATSVYSESTTQLTSGECAVLVPSRVVPVDTQPGRCSSFDQVACEVATHRADNPLRNRTTKKKR